MGDDTFLFFKPSGFVVLCYGSPSERIQRAPVVTRIGWGWGGPLEDMMFKQRRGR